MAGFSTERPPMDGYQQAYENKGKYGQNFGRPYIHPDVPMYVPQDGPNCIRVVDPIELLTLKTYFFNVYFHQGVGYKKDYFLCTDRHGRGPCPSCEKVNGELWENDKEMAKKLSPDMRRLIWVLDLKKPQEAGILKLWSCPRTLSDEILTQSKRPDADVYVDIAHPTNGVPIYFERSGKGLNTKYTGVKLGTEPYPLTEDIAEQRFAFNDVLLWHDYKEFKDALELNTGDEGPDGAADAYESQKRLFNQGSSNTETISGGAGAGASEIDYSDLNTIDPNNKECFRKEYDKYNECATCVDAAKCKLPWPVIVKPQKVEKSSKSSKSEKTSEPEIDYSDLETINPANKECFRKEYDKYNECESCSDAPKCKLPWPYVAAKKSKEDRPSKPSKTVAGSGSTETSSPTRVSSPASMATGADKVKSAQEKLRAEIARRKAGQ